MASPGNYNATGHLFAGSDLVKASYFGAKDWAEGARQRDAERRQEAYEDDFADALKERIESIFDNPANVAALLKVLDTTNNPLKRIVNESSVLYARRPARKLSTGAATAQYRDILRKAGEGVVMPRLNRMATLHNTTLLYVRPCHDGLTLRLVLPQDCTVWPDPDDPTMPLAVEFRELDAAAPNAKACYWQFDRRPGSAGIRKYDTNGKQDGETLPLKYADEHGRPLIPFVAFHREWPTYSFWDATSGNDIYELTIMASLWETWTNYLLKTDSTRQKYATGGALKTEGGPNDGGPEGIISLTSGDGTPINVGEFSSQADWAGLGGQARRKLENVLNNSGLVLPDNRTSGDPTSGFALLVRSQGLRNIQESQKPSYVRSEESLYRVVTAVSNFERTNPAFPLYLEPELPPPSVAKPSIAFAEVDAAKTVEERKAELDIAEQEIRLGLASPVSVYVRMNPEATEEEALAAIQKNQADTKALKPEPKPMPAPFGAQPKPADATPPDEDAAEEE